LYAALAANEQLILAPDCSKSQGSFGGIVVDSQATVIEVARERVPVVDQIVLCPRGWRRRRELGPVLLQPGLDLIDDRLREFFATLIDLFGRQFAFARLPLDREQRMELPDGFTPGSASRGTVSSVPAGSLSKENAKRVTKCA
jgi:hypothetical protein